jgi:hypothetical protein
VSGTKYREFDADFQSVEKIPSKKVIAKFRNIQFSSIIQCCGKKLSASNFILANFFYNFFNGQISIKFSFLDTPIKRCETEILGSFQNIFLEAKRTQNG